MNGIHDLGGMDGLGPIDIESNEPVFHADWERRVFGVMMGLFARGHYNVDEFRHAIERMGAPAYLNTSYYEHWLHAMELLLAEKAVVSDGERASGKSAGGGAPETPPLPQDEVAGLVATGGSTRVDADVTPKFAAGDYVVVRNLNPTTHTRVPRYVRGKRGMIDRDHGVFVFPDTAAHGGGESPQHVYSVRFEGTELWGDDGARAGALYVDLWDDYLDPA